MTRASEVPIVTRRDWLRDAGAAGAAVAGSLLAAPSIAAASPPQDTRTRDRFPISLNTSTLRGFKLPLAKIIEIAAAAGYAGIEPWPNEVSDHEKAHGSLEDAAKQLRDNGLRVTGAIAFWQWMVDDDSARSKALEEAKRHMDQLARLGATHVAAPPSGNVENVELLRAAERYRALLDASAASGVIPAVEVWGFAKNLSRLGECVLVALEADHPKACILPDVYHLYKGGSGLAGIRRLDGSLLAGFHFNDYPDIPRDKIGDGDRVYPGDGVAPLGKLFRDLGAIGYEGPISIELFNREYWKGDPLDVAKTALAKTRAVMHKALAE